MFAGASPAVPPAVAPENVVSLDRLSRLRVIDVGIAAAGGLERDVSLRLRHGALRDHPVFQLLAGNLVRAILHHQRVDPRLLSQGIPPRPLRPPTRAGTFACSCFYVFDRASKVVPVVGTAVRPVEVT